MLYPITTLSAAILGGLLFFLSIRVIRMRHSSGVNLGAGDNKYLERRIRAQANLSEYAPMCLILLFLAEAQGAYTWIIALCALVFVVGRLIHAYALSFTEGWMPGRIGGMASTFTAINALVVVNLVLLLV